MYKLHYAALDLNGDIPCYEFKSVNDLIDFVDDKGYGRNRELVWLLAKNELSDIFISESYLSIQDFILNKKVWRTTGVFFLQEYSSYEAAYEVALMMKETSPLCYEPKADETPR